MEMEVALGNGEEAKPKACFSEIVSDKHESGEKTLEEDSTQENDVRVSENGKQKLLGAVDDNKAKENDVEMENLNDAGAYSLLKLKQDFSYKDNNLQEEKEIDEDEEEDDDEEFDEEEEEEEHGYYVGDFVWGKIKNHPWWPGQIYDPSDASDLALKIKQKGKLLVAYFGDDSFAWCAPSQLKPFAENFKDFSKVSNSRAILSAVEEAVEEMGRHIERLLICDCAEEKNKFDSPEAKNAGIKEGVSVRDVRREMISSLLVGKPRQILKDVKGFAETVSFSNLLELEILKRKVSAFYRSKGGYGLTEYHEPQSVPGLEDKNNDDEDENIDDGIQWRRGGAKRPSKDKALVLLEKCSGFPDHRLLHRRKEKSLAEINENDLAAKVRFDSEPADGNVKSGRKRVKRCDEVKSELENVSTITPRRRRMSKTSTIEDTGHKKVEENSKGKNLSRKRKKRVSDDDGGSEGREELALAEEFEKNEVSDVEMDIDSTPLASLQKIVRVEKTSGTGDTSTPTSKRERKKSKCFSPDYVWDFSWKGRKKRRKESSKVSNQSQTEDQMTDGSDSLLAEEEVKVDNHCELALVNCVGHQELSKELSNAVDFLRLGATPEEMRDLIRVTALGTGYPKDISSREMVREFMSIYRSFTYHDGANSSMLLESNNSSDKGKEEMNMLCISNGEKIGSVKNGSAKKVRKDRKRKAEEIEQIGKEEKETNKHGSTKKVKKPKKPKSKKKQGDEEETRKEESEPAKKKRKVKKPRSEEEEEIWKKASESAKKERKVKKARAGEEEETRKEKSEKELLGAELYMTFSPGSSMPKKEELIEIYEKYGALDEERTCIFYNNFCARVVFLNIADGEKAFESSQVKCPLASSSTVNFRLKYPNERREEKKPEIEAAETTTEVDYVKKKLEEMRSLMDEESKGGMSEEKKVKLEDEMVNLLEKVRKMKSS